MQSYNSDAVDQTVDAFTLENEIFMPEIVLKLCMFFVLTTID